MTPRFLTVEELFAIHHRVILDHGGSLGIRDRGLLESAASVPGSQFSGEYLHSDIPAMAAAYLFHLCKNHPFIDGDKRVAFAAADVFLELNSHNLEASDLEFEQLTLGAADGSISKDQTTEFFRTHVAKTDLSSE